MNPLLAWRPVLDSFRVIKTLPVVRQLSVDQTANHVFVFVFSSLFLLWFTGEMYTPF